MGGSELSGGTLHSLSFFYPTALKGRCSGGFVGGGKKFVRAVSQKS